MAAPDMVLGFSLADRAGNLDFRRDVATACAIERAGFDFLLVPDVAALEGTAARPMVKHEAFALLAALSTATGTIGLVVTASLDFNDPYNLARALATLDHLSAGRAGWRGTTGSSRREARNFGLDDVAPAAVRHARAAELLDVVQGLHDSWDDGAIPRDKTSGIFFDRDGMRPVAHAGANFSVRGPLDVPTTPQRQLPLFCDGGSDGDWAFAVSHADVVCVGPGFEGRRGADRTAPRILMNLDIAASAGPADVADEMAIRLAAGAADGFIISGTEAGAAALMAELRRRGRRGDAPRANLRERLGLSAARSRHATMREKTSV